MASLGELERAVMERLWSAEAPVAATTLRDELADRGVALTTVHTVLTRLEQKGFVVHDDERPRRFPRAGQPRGARRRAHARGARPVGGPAGRAGALRRRGRPRRGPPAARAARPATPRRLTAPGAAHDRGRRSPCWPPCSRGRCRPCSARAGWPRRDPLVALVGWQAIGLAGGLSIIGALLVHGLAPWGARCRRRGRFAVRRAGGRRAGAR